MPTSTDLVTDLPADFEVFGQAVDTSLADLKGGTTGQVLSKASNTNMDFTWVTTDDANAIQNSIVDAKGDLVAASANDTPARLAVGNNGETRVADSSTSTGLRYQGNYAAGKNEIINGAFDVWQRGTSISLTTATLAYTTDRFYAYTDFSAGTSSVSRQTFTPGAAPVAGYEGQYFARYTAGSTTTYFEIGQKIENVQTYAGQTVTFSFWAKASANTTLTLTMAQNFGSGGSTQVNTSGGTNAVTTAWQRFTATVALPSISGKTIGTSSYLLPNLSATSITGSQTIDFWGWQLEAGNTATAFQTATGTLQGELAACQRYYWRTASSTAYVFVGNGQATSTTAGAFMINNPVPMRVGALTVDYSTLGVTDALSIQSAITSLIVQQASNLVNAISTGGSSGLTQYRPYFLSNQASTSGYIGFGAEL